MKKIISILTVFIVLFVTISCSKSDDNSSSDDSSSGDNSSVNQVEETAQAGTWRITYFYDSDQEKTNNFTGYAFTFNSGGSLVAVKGNNTVTGTWSVTDDNSSSSSSDTHFNIFFSSPNDFEDLSDDWGIVSTSSTKIELKDVSGGNGGTDFLTFEKN